MKNPRNNWIEKAGGLSRKFEFQNFAEALDFVNKIGQLAEKENHHPDISFGWGYVEVRLSTHSENAITDKDRQLARKINVL